MRKKDQKMILEILDTFSEAHKEIGKQEKAGDISHMTNLLADCQDSTEQIIGFIEGFAIDSVQTVALLREYEKLLYRISVEANNRLVLIGKLEKQIKRIIDSVRKELKPTRFEMVFFPYKASMWDSMESVYLAAKDDSVCDAYVVPIPYFNRLSDGAMGEMAYEGGDYPSDIPVTNWREYDVEARHPDVIVIHNPYDGYNLVTSVHPDFYAARLKDLTDMLVYIPYFVTGQDIEENFCFTVGAVYANHVIVESETVRKRYIEVFKEYEREHHCEGRFGNLNEKFVALGSPKFDKVTKAKREDYQLPSEWEEMIAGKKVILYNTTISGILADTEKYLIELRKTLATFGECDDVALWWRPHPLIEATLMSMRPEFLREYQEIVEMYKHGNCNARQ